CIRALCRESWPQFGVLQNSVAGELKCVCRQDISSLASPFPVARQVLAVFLAFRNRQPIIETSKICFNKPDEYSRRQLKGRSIRDERLFLCQLTPATFKNERFATLSERDVHIRSHWHCRCRTGPARSRR